MTAKDAKIELALILVDQMLDFGDAPIGLVEVRRLLYAATIEESQCVTPPPGDHNQNACN